MTTELLLLVVLMVAYYAVWVWVGKWLQRVIGHMAGGLVETSSGGYWRLASTASHDGSIALGWHLLTFSVGLVYTLATMVPPLLLFWHSDELATLLQQR